MAVVDLDERTAILSKFLEHVSVEDLAFIPDELLIGAIVAGKVGAIENLASILIDKHATRLKLEREKHAGVVRTEGAVPDSVINTLILALLASCTLYGQPPPQTLNDLVSVALRVKRRSTRQAREPEKRSAAIEHMMRNPDMGTRKLARIVQVRKERGLTSAEVAKQLGLSRPFYTQLENGTRRMTLVYYLAICRVLQVQPGELLK